MPTCNEYWGKIAGKSHTNKSEFKSYNEDESKQVIE